MAGSTALALYIAVSCLAFVTSKIIVSCLLYRRWTRKRSIIQDTMTGGKFVLFRSSTTHSLNSKVFVKKTMKLSNKDIIGSGGQGTVYRLTINDTAAFAVKRLSKGNSDVDRGFERELDAMGDIKHRNIVTLHGYYVSPHFNFLVYELMPNGSLDSLLHGNSRKVLKPLDWATRYKVAIGAARGISYLHHDCIPHIIHRDIKSSNILLDHNMEARVSDFGLATLLEPSRTHVTTIVAGSFGYLAPEYFDTGRATTKGDVYSFGVVLLELLTGKRPTDESFIEGGTKLVTWVKGIIEVNEEQHAIDKALTCYPIEEIKRVFHVAEKCLEPDPSERPTMAEVLKMLEHIKTSNTPAVP
ncbi:receptor-like serine/threonine-protein kinase At1g78530 isoform X1 [Zingiber officinale]|uniref:Protein kinase domain-containing protein n=2 Tax=Zingiber officinale TaxID=94328 RepID=A0A8J5FHL0_ZINOF|nr:receptor-like serine/threonine-protein kinase At1g78530 isoform X1 [Zingiber officinale]KAG6485798.1 hypothetical protein ZIOFF_054363 [Zingiber officinale]